MATTKETANYILDCLQQKNIFSVRPMFGEYAIYANGKVIGLICDNNLFVKITKESASLEEQCEKDSPYPGAKPYYLINESQLKTIRELPEILIEIAKNIPNKKIKPRPK